ncbi:MAG: alpha/beta hydrolase [Actinomycetota bacterium]
METPQVLEGAEEFELGAGPVGALLVHGFTGSPQGLRGVGEYLAGRGIAVAAVRLPGHGTTWQDLNTRTGDEWIDAVEAGFEKISASTDEVFIVALSFGAALALDFAARNPDRVAGVVTLAGFVHTNDPRRFLAPVISKLVKSLPAVGNDIADPTQREIAYERLPAAAAYHMLRVVKRARTSLPQVTAPILIMHGRNDHVVHPRSADIIYNSVASEDKELVYLERSFHVITLDYDREELLDRTFEFIKNRAKHAL